MIGDLCVFVNVPGWFSRHKGKETYKCVVLALSGSDKRSSMYRKSIRRNFVLVLTLVVLMAAALPVSAATVTQDGLVVTLTTDKRQYTEKEAITVNLTVENKNTFPVEDVKLDYELPSGYNFQIQGDTSTSIAKLGAGEQSSYTVKSIPPTAASNPATGDRTPVAAWILLAGAYRPCKDNETGKHNCF